MTELLVAGPDSSGEYVRDVAREGAFPTAVFEEREFPDGEVLLRCKNPTALDEARRILYVARAYPEPAASVFAVLQALDIVRDYNPEADLALCLPYMPFARQDERFLGGEAISAKTLLSMFEGFDVASFVTFDVHNPDVRRYTSVDLVNLSMTKELARRSKGLAERERVVLVAPDEGARKRVEDAARETNLESVVLEKERDEVSGEVTVESAPLTSYESSTLVFLDDLISTGGTMVEAARALLQKKDLQLIAAATHCQLLENAETRLFRANFDAILGTDTIPSKYSVVSTAPKLAETAKRL